MSFLRIAASAAIFTLLSAVCATAKPITTAGETNLRKSPGTDSPVLTIIPKGTTVEVGKCSNGWCETSTDGRDGFVIARNLGLAPARRARFVPQVYDEDVEEVGPPVYTGDGDGAGRVRERFQPLGTPRHASGDAAWIPLK
jgi:uncharacterized protein YraI